MDHMYHEEDAMESMRDLKRVVNEMGVPVYITTPDTQLNASDTDICRLQQAQARSTCLKHTSEFSILPYIEGLHLHTTFD
jgi:hypothetical protein